ncbi:hypothetical protein [Antrihabitans cavernicola]|uniref:Uncharacterized protein n=1 Tax=Antrihabitans cavernicola TaxID=2495913 RepID=A0A5A7SHD5_9NOCA|nr:hypothetical protein [Spelaeibacter cavernicola]KAA0023905.1 hypothetical protein FOY51_04795 [Spelaeibacter cavernicola]
MTASHALTLFLAQTPTSPTGPEFGKASPIGLVIILALLVGTVLLIRNMNKKIKRLPESFEPEHPEPDQDADEGTDRGAAHPDDKRSGSESA